MFKRKLLISLLVLGLVITGAVTAFGDIDLGFSQTMTNTYYRLDVENFFFEVPVDGKLYNFNLGGQLDTTFWALYGTGAVTFKSTSYEFKPESLSLGLGYPVEFGPIKIFAEMRVSSPQWLDANTWTAKPYLGFQFTWSAFRQKIPEE